MGCRGGKVSILCVGDTRSIQPTWHPSDQCAVGVCYFNKEAIEVSWTRPFVFPVHALLLRGADSTQQMCRPHVGFVTRLVCPLSCFYNLEVPNGNLNQRLHSWSLALRNRQSHPAPAHVTQRIVWAERTGNVGDTATHNGADPFTRTVLRQCHRCALVNGRQNRGEGPKCLVDDQGEPGLLRAVRLRDAWRNFRHALEPLFCVIHANWTTGHMLLVPQAGCVTAAIVEGPCNGQSRSASGKHKDLHVPIPKAHGRFVCVWPYSSHWAGGWMTGLLRPLSGSVPFALRPQGVLLGSTAVPAEGGRQVITAVPGIAHQWTEPCPLDPRQPCRLFRWAWHDGTVQEGGLWLREVVPDPTQGANFPSFRHPTVLALRGCGPQPGVSLPTWVCVDSLRMTGISPGLENLGIAQTDSLRSRLLLLLRAGWGERPSQVPKWTRAQAALVRALDVVTSIVALIVTAPIMLMLAAWIRLESPGPAIFRQTRVGKNRRRPNAASDNGRYTGVERRKQDIGGKPFTFYKFRTMYVDARERFPELYRYQYDEEEIKTLYVKIPEDPRLTPFGRRLRKTTLDELPNFISVLKGDMTLVGPRPEIPEMFRYYKPWQRVEFDVKPGVTGLAQVSGRGLLSFQETARLDVEFATRRSFGTILGIIFKTITVSLMRIGAF